MKKVNKEILKVSAKNVMIDMTEKEYDEFLNDFDSIERNLVLLENVEVPEDTEPMVFPYEIINELTPNGEDLDSLDKDELFKNSNNYQDGIIRIKKVIK